MHNVEERKLRFAKAWEQTLLRLFPTGIPENHIWETPDDIAAALMAIASENLNIHKPDDGISEFRACRLVQNNLLEWADDSTSLDVEAFVLRPARLTFWNPGTQTHEANFVLETATLAPSGLCKVEGKAGVEEVVDAGNGKFLKSEVWWDREQENGDLPAKSRLLHRTTKPALYAFFSKAALYESRWGSFDSHQAYHNDPKTFRHHVEAFAKIEF